MRVNVSFARSQQFVPSHSPAKAEDLKRLNDFVQWSRRLLVLTGAGVSTESGIPDYRSERVGRYARTDARPVQFQDFMKSPTARQRYWARNFVGWPWFSSLQPNLNHVILADWEKKGLVHWLVTQNVDGLHSKAGSQALTELHGSGYRVHCRGCKSTFDRHFIQDFIREQNVHWEATAVEVAPDGDVDLTPDQIRSFKTPSCPSCSNGILQPQMVFFGDNVPKEINDIVHRKLSDSDSVLILGSSLQVYSAFRIFKRSSELNLPIALINIGPTRADDTDVLKISAKCSDILSCLSV